MYNWQLITEIYDEITIDYINQTIKMIRHFGKKEIIIIIKI